MGEKTKAFHEGKAERSVERCSDNVPRELAALVQTACGILQNKGAVKSPGKIAL